jgi:hypothetical protein
VFQTREKKPKTAGGGQLKGSFVNGSHHLMPSSRVVTAHTIVWCDALAAGQAQLDLNVLKVVNSHNSLLMMYLQSQTNAKFHQVAAMIK